MYRDRKISSCLGLGVEGNWGLTVKGCNFFEGGCENEGVFLNNLVNLLKALSCTL